MTEQEAQHRLEVMRDLYAWECSEELEAVNIAISALEKQIPKKPDFEGDGYWDGQLVYDTWICPNCGKHYEVDCDEYDFCPNCGQAILRE